VSTTLHAPYQRETRARWIITAAMCAAVTLWQERFVFAFGAQGPSADR